MLELSQKRRIDDKTLGVLILADLSHAPSKIYVNKKINYCSGLGLSARIVDLFSIDNEQAIKEITESNEMTLVQLPLPQKHKGLEKLIPPERDIEGFHPLHLGNLVCGKPTVYPCTASAIVNYLDFYEFDFESKRVCIINDTIVVGKPLALALNIYGSTVTICNKYTKNLKEITLSSDLIVSAVGHPEFSLKSDMINKGTWVVDVGSCKIDKKIIGDLDIEAREKCGVYSPPIGGIGPLTVAHVVENMLILQGK